MAVAEVILENGESIFYVASSITRKTHAEIRLLSLILEEGHDLSSIARFYTELEPCGFSFAYASGGCKTALQTFLPGLEINFSFPYAGAADAAVAYSVIRQAMRAFTP